MKTYRIGLALMSMQPPNTFSWIVKKKSIFFWLLIFSLLKRSLLCHNMWIDKFFTSYDLA